MIKELREDTHFHASVKCYTFNVYDLTKGTPYECTSYVPDFADEPREQLRFAMLMSEQEAFAHAKARVIRRFTAGDWKPYTQAADVPTE
uniref:Uncharacterized protein n=1 Tax=Dulem virus 42 TaxID=3145760 RepID=A0AAU8B7X0_9CAUD